MQHKFQKQYKALQSFIPDKNQGRFGPNNDLNPLYEVLCDPSPPSTSQVQLIARVHLVPDTWAVSLSGFGVDRLPIVVKQKP